MLSQLQARAKTLLQAHAWFEGVDIITEEEGDLGNELARAFGGGMKFFAVVLTPSGRTITPQGENKQPYIIHDVMIYLVEDPTFNTSGAKHAKNGVVPVIEALHNQWNGLGGEPRGRTAKVFEFQNYAPLPGISDKDDPLYGFTIIAVELSTRAQN